MIEIVKSDRFDLWFAALRDRRAKARIEARILRLAMGNPGDAKPVGHGIGEMRVDYGPGYRVYYMQRRQSLIVLLCGGNKTSQASDVRSAIAIAKEWKE